MSTRTHGSYRQLLADLLCRRYTHEVDNGLPHEPFTGKPGKAVFVALQRQLFWMNFPVNSDYRWCFKCNTCNPIRIIARSDAVCPICPYKYPKTPRTPLRRLMHAGRQNAERNGAPQDVVNLWKDLPTVEHALWDPWVADHPNMPPYRLKKINPAKALTPSNYRMELVGTE